MLQQCRETIANWLCDYNEVRPHSSIARISPARGASHQTQQPTRSRSGRSDLLRNTEPSRSGLPNVRWWAVTVDGAGIVWANEIATDTVVRLDPKTGEMKVIDLSSKNVSIRKMAVDASGRLWYMGPHSGKLGVVE